jgi:hypothetical protein
MVILPEEFGYIAGRALFYCWKSTVILPEECCYIFVMKIVDTFVCASSQGHRTHLARTKIAEG